MKKKFIPNVWDAVKRFPATVLFCLLSTGLWMYLYKTKSFKSHTALFFSFLIGIFIFVPLTQFSEKSSKKITGIILNVLGFIFVGLFYYSIKVVGDKISLYRLFLFIIASLVLMPAIFSKDNKRLWNDIIVIFKNLITTIFFTYVMLLGVIIAIAAVNYLFELKLKDDIYLYTFYFFTGTYAPLLFLSNFYKKDTKILIDAESKALKIIIKFIITPLSLLYLLILYLYSIKIILTWNLPKGQVSYMVISFSVLAILTHLITYPYKDKGIFKFIHKYIYYFILPLLILLAVAIGIRLKSYGITENRYYIVIFGLWILFLSLFGIFTKFKKLKMIFISLSVISAMTTFGIWGAFSISKRSQIHRFEQELKKYNLLSNDNKLLPYDKKVDDLKNMKSILDYLDEMGYLKDATKEIVSEDTTKVNAKYFYDKYNLGKISYGRYGGKYFNIRLGEKDVIAFDISKYEYFISVEQSYTANFEDKKIIIDDEHTKIEYAKDTLMIYHDSQKIAAIPIKEIAKDILQKNDGKNYITLDSDYEYKYQNLNAEILFILKSLNGNKNSDSEIYSISNVRFLLFYNYHKK